MKKEGRLFEDSQATSNFSPPNFRTMMPVTTLLRGLGSLLIGLYEAEPFFKRALRSLEVWRPRATQVPPKLPLLSYELPVLFASMWKQGIRSSYRLAYWRFLGLLIWRWSREPAKLWMGFTVLLSAHHFVIYAHQVADELERECKALEAAEAPSTSERQAANVSAG